MDLTTLRSKRLIPPTVASVVTVGVGGVWWTSAANANVQGSVAVPAPRDELRRLAET
jgi:hypothetical protein